MKVMHLVGYFPPERLGGVGEFVAGLHKGLRDAGHKSIVVTTGIRSQADIRRISRRPLGWFFKSVFWVGRAMQYDVVHCQAGEALPFLLLLRLRRRRPRILTTFHVSYAGMSASLRPYEIEGRSFARGLRPLLERTVISWIHRVVDTLAIRLSDAVNTISVQSARDVLGEGEAESALIVYYGLGELSDETEDRGWIEPVEILYAGTYGHRKRVVTLPYVLERVRRDIPEARMRILGFTPEHEPEVARLFEKKGLLSCVDFAGVKTSVELPPYYSRSGVLVVPSAYEGLPFVILEAMRSGLPVVATRVSGHPEAIVDGENGFLVDLDRPDQMASRCVRILSDRATRNRMGAAAQRTIRERFTLKRQVGEYLKIYENLAGGRPGGSARPREP